MKAKRIAPLMKEAGESALAFAGRVLYGRSGEKSTPTATQMAEAQAVIDAMDKGKVGKVGPTKAQQRLVRRLAQGLPDTSAVKAAPAPEPVDEHELAMRRFRMANHIPEPR